MDPVLLQDAYIELETIFKAWVRSEDLDELREALGVDPPPGRRRTTRQVNEEKAIVERMVAAARNGSDMSSYRKAADVLNGDEKQIERAWNQWGELTTLSARRSKAAQEGKLTELRAHLAAEASAAAEQFPHMASLFTAPEAIELHLDRICQNVQINSDDIAALLRLPALPDIN